MLRILYLFALSLLFVFIADAKETLAWQKNSKVGMCVGLSRIADIDLELQKIKEAWDETEDPDRKVGAATYGTGYANGLIDMHRTLKRATHDDQKIAKQIFKQTGCEIYSKESPKG